MPSTGSGTNKAIVLYMPALHAGYLSLFRKHEGAKVFVLGKSFIDAFPRLNRDLRAVAPLEMVEALRALGFDAEVLEASDVKHIDSFAEVVIPDEDVTRDFATKYLEGVPVTSESLFLRWDGVFANRENAITPDRTIDTAGFDRECMKEAYAESARSADWWRQIGALLEKDGVVVARGHTRYFPSDLALDIFGTPRSTVDAGERPDLYISMHAEADVIAVAAKDGVLLQGASLYTTTFPCINCAFLIARTGIKTLYYTEGYSKIDAEGVLKSAGVELVRITDISASS